MTTDEFAIITRRVIARNSFEEFLPTACYPARHHLKTLEGLPADLEPEPAVLDWAASSIEPGEEFLVAFKADSTHFTVVRCVGAFKESETYAAQ